MCLVDADLDGVTDVVGYGTALMALHGKTGATVWSSGHEHGGHAKLYCDPRGGLVLYREDEFVVTGLDPRSGRELWVAKLSDKLVELGFGQQCLIARAADGTAAQLDARTGAATACRQNVIAQPANRAREIQARAGDLEIAVAATSAPGTRRALVRAKRAGRTAWETAIPEMALDGPRVSNGAVISATVSAVYVAGKKHGGPGMIVALLNPSSGAIIAKRDEARVVKNDVFFMDTEATSAAVYVESFGMLHAYDARTLAPLWWVGTMWAG